MLISLECRISVSWVKHVYIVLLNLLLQLLYVFFFYYLLLFTMDPTTYIHLTLFRRLVQHFIAEKLPDLRTLTKLCVLLDFLIRDNTEIVVVVGAGK